MKIRTHQLRLWGAGGAFVAAVFVVWLLLFPDLIASYFAWPAEPRLGQVFLAVAWVFRIGFFFSVWREPAWHRVRWIFWGNLVFTSTLLLATFLHADRFNWSFPTATIWLILYVAEPVAMIYVAPREAEAWNGVPVSGGAIQPGLKWLLVVEAAILGVVGAFLLFNPDFMATRWVWPIKPLGARIIAAWFLGWAVWAGTLARAYDWEEIRIGVWLNILFGLSLLASIVAFLPLFDFTHFATQLYAAGIAILTLALSYFAWVQTRQQTSEK